jgi:hypothetical protein
MARAKQVVSVLFIKCNWTAHVGANLGVSNDSVITPRSLGWILFKIGRIYSHE